MIAIFSTGLILIPDKAISENENRALEQFPKFSSESFWNGSFTADLGVYLSDQFPLRDFFVGMKAYIELSQLKGENNDVINAGGVLIPIPTNSTEALSSNASAIKYFTDRVDIPVTVVALPRTADVFAELLPAYYPADKDEATLTAFREEMAKSGAKLPDLITPLSESNEYYHTDHHYTTHGAYETYLKLADSLGYTPYAREDFRIEQVTEDFRGTAMRTSGFYMTKPDEIVLYRYDGDEEYTVTADGKEINLYDFDKLEETDKYAVFLGGNHARVDVTSGEKPKLLVIRDSYADSLAPFLARHFDLIMIDYRYFRGGAAEIIEKEGISQMLILQGINEFCEVKNLSYLAKGVKR